MLCGHGRGYQRSFPIRGVDSADTLRPHPVTTTDSGVFDTSQGTVHLVLGCGGSDAGSDASPDAGPASVAAEVTETAAWSARRDTATGYGIAVFDVDPGAEAGGQTSITVRYYHAVDADPASRHADRRLLALRNVHSGQTEIRRAALAPERAAAVEPRLNGGPANHGRLGGRGRAGPYRRAMVVADVVVVGAGVVGLTTAISLAEAGVPTPVAAAEPPSRLTSMAAGAIWGRSGAAPPTDARVGTDGTRGALRAGRRAERGGAPAARARGGATLASPPPWTDLLPTCGPARRRPAGRVLVRLVLHRARHQHAGLPGVPAQPVRGRGGTIGYAAVPSLAAVDAPVVVNCTGIGARALMGDDSLVPIRGQIIVVENPGIEEFYIDHGAPGSWTTCTRSRTAM